MALEIPNPLTSGVADTFPQRGFPRHFPSLLPVAPQAQANAAPQSAVQRRASAPAPLTAPTPVSTPVSTPIPTPMPVILPQPVIQPPGVRPLPVPPSPVINPNPIPQPIHPPLAAPLPTLQFNSPQDVFELFSAIQGGTMDTYLMQRTGSPHLQPGMSTAIFQLFTDILNGTLQFGDSRQLSGFKDGGAVIDAKRTSAKVGRVMGEFKKGKLMTSAGKKVKGPKQAMAIALSEAKKDKKPLKGAQEGTIVGAPPAGPGAGPLSSNLPGPQAGPPAAPATPPPEVVIETAADIIKAALEELRAQGVFPPLGGAPISTPLGAGAPPPPPLG